MAHIEKYTKNQARQVCNHDRRKYTDNTEHIDPARSHLNYDLGPGGDPWEFICNKIDMSKKSGGRFNSRSVAVVSVIVTLPKGFDGDERLFFETAKKHLDGIFGADNCISATVHYDEQGEPHLHYKAVPVVDRGGVKQFNAKSIVNRAFLQRFHPDLEKAMTAVFGRPVGILNGATTRGNLTVPQLKEQTEEYHTMRGKAKKQKKRMEYYTQKADEAVDDYDKAVDEYNDLLDEIADLKKEKTALAAEVARLKNERAHLADDVLKDDPKPTHEWRDGEAR